MKLLQLSCQGFRKFEEARFQDFSNLNLFLGPNGSGKSSLLEAIQLLANGRSFRTEKTESWMRYQAEKAQLRAAWGDETPLGEGDSEPTLAIHLSVERGQNPKWLRLPEQRACSRAGLSRQFPLQWIGPDSLRFLTDGPELRRRLLDWGGFYHFADYERVWRQHQRALKQRNVLLKHAQASSELDFWDEMLLKAQSALAELRCTYMQEVMPRWQVAFQTWFPKFPVRCCYDAGWDTQEDYRLLLQSQREKEKILGYTQWGAHRADLRFECREQPLKQSLSRGEMKWVLFLIHGVQALLLQETTMTAQPPLFLLDDLFAELDSETVEKVVHWLVTYPMQTFMTALPASSESILRSEYAPDFQTFKLRET